MRNLKKLHAWGCCCELDQNGITGLNLFELNIDDNSKITNVSFMQNLKYLKHVIVD